MRRLVFTIPFVLALGGCDGCEKKPEPALDAAATSPPATDAAAAIDTARADAAVGAADAGKLDMGNCPTSVAGAQVTIKDVEGGVEVSIVGKDDATTKEIRERVKKLAEADPKDAGAGVKHDHSGSGGGRTGRCTIIMRNTKLATSEIPKGAKVTVVPTAKGEVDWLRRETRERDNEAKSAAAEGAGVQRMANCPSAVEGSKTLVKDSKEGAIVVVTGPADKVAEIRTRAKHVAAVAKKGDAGKIEHSGEGTGGGGLGRCPVVVEGDTIVEVKEIDGGVEVEVKTKGDVAALQKESKTRAALFAPK